MKFVIYQRPFSPKALEAAALIAEAGFPYDVEIIRNKKDANSVNRLVALEAGRQARWSVTLPRVFEDPMDNGDQLNHIGCTVSSVQRWLSEYTVSDLEDILYPFNDPERRDLQGVKFPARPVSNHRAVNIYRQALQGRPMRLVMIQPSTMWVTDVQSWNLILDELLGGVPDTNHPSLPFHLAASACLQYGLNSCGVVMDESSEHLYNIIWVDMGDNRIHVVPFDPVTREVPIIGEGLYRATAGQVIVP